MKKFKTDPDKEIVITISNLLSVLEGLAQISEILEEIKDKIPEKENKRLLLVLVVTFVCIAQMFPREEQEIIIDMMDEDLGINLREMPRF